MITIMIGDAGDGGDGGDGRFKKRRSLRSAMSVGSALDPVRGFSKAMDILWSGRSRIRRIRKLP